MKLKPMGIAPKDRTRIVAWCDHAADPYFDEENNILTPYGANAEGVAVVKDGWNIIYWHEAINDGEFFIPAGWIADSDNESAANPIGWLYALPEKPTNLREITND